MGVINFNGVSTNSKRFSAPILVETPPDYVFPSRDANFTHVPGRDGDVLVDNGSYNNVTRTYNLAIGDEDIDYARLAYELSDWLHSANGYAKLTDSYDPEHYCMAAFVDEGSIVNILQHAGRISVSFNCKPQRYLISGDDKITLTLPDAHHAGNNIIFNPTMFESRPLIKVNGTENGFSNDELLIAKKNVYGQFIVEHRIIIDGTIGPIYIDCELMDCYLLDQQEGQIYNKNNCVTFDNNKFPSIPTGTVSFGWTSGITSVEVIPRWWTI